jgi:pyruvate formate lyase activating enzyme
MKEVVCELCPRGCEIPEGGAGDCRVRVNLAGKLYATTYGRPSSVHIDPMEKKPLYHFHPGTPILSIATAGCNLHCRNCQNWQLSQRGGEEMEELYHLMPEEVVQEALSQRCRSIAYTYSDPIIFYEYVYDTSELAHAQGLHNVMVTAGYINQPPLKRLCGVMDATNTDLKGFNDKFYREVCSATLKPVLDALVTFREEGVWLEVTHLVIPTLNDDLSQIRRMSEWIARELGTGTPLHFSRFRPMYQLRNLPPTPVETLERARAEAMEAGLKYVYIGNVFGHEAESTYCPQDGSLLIHRVGHRILENNLTEDGRCPGCDEQVPGVWM